MSSIAILIPVLNRPHRVGPLVESVESAARFVPCRPVFVASPGDRAEMKAIEQWDAESLIVSWRPGPGDYARKINHAFNLLRDEHEFLFLGADDLRFHPGWAERALAAWWDTGACVIGTNDIGNPRTAQGHSTHSLVHRDYWDCGTADGEGILHPGYRHLFVDDELVATARARHTYFHAADSIVEHVHPDWRKADDDETYRKGQEGFGADQRLFRERRRFWHGGRE